MKNILIITFLLVAISTFAQDKLSGLRTSKKIVTIETVSAPYYTIQILALKNPPTDANFFQNVDEVKEYRCNDGYVRYCVGSYESFTDANAALSDVREHGYKEAFVANTKRFDLEEGSYQPSSSKLVIKPDKDYVIQVGAFRYPVYLTFFENVDVVYEYRMNDKIFRYTTEPAKGTEIESRLSEIKSLGYKSAFIVDYDNYAPFKIE